MTIQYVGIVKDSSSFDQTTANLTTGTTATAGNLFDFRMGTAGATVSRDQALHALELIQRWVMQGGLNQAGANLPLPTGAG